MESFEFASVLITILLWITTTGAIALVLSHLLKNTLLSPAVWWCGLGLSLLIFIPAPDTLVNQFGDLNWVAQNNQLMNADSPHVVFQKKEVALLGNYGSSLCLSVVMLVSLWRLIRLHNNYRRVYKLVVESVPFETQACAQPVYLTAFKNSAFAVGLFKPVIALPDYLMTLSSTQQFAVIAHEETHIRNGDHLTKLLWRILVELFWFNPFLAYLENGFNQSIEHRCDRQTLTRHNLVPSDYAKTLLQCLKMGVESTNRSPVVGFSAQGVNLKDYKRRVSLIVERPLFRGQLKSVLLVFLSLFLLIVSANSAMAAFWQSQEDWIYPVTNPRLTSSFGHIAKLRAFKPHQGIDLRGPLGTPIYASASGRVMVADDQSLPGGYGKVIVIQHAGQWQSLYAHLDEILVEPGKPIQQGDIIGTMGETGRASGVHLHFELVHQGKPVDPLAYIRAQDSKLAAML